MPSENRSGSGSRGVLARYAAPRVDRRGVGGVLLVGAVLLIVMAVLGLAQNFLASQITDVASRATLGRIAFLAAESAIGEARGILARKTNDPTDPLFKKMREATRKQPSAETQIDTFSIPAAQLANVSKLFAPEAAFGAFELQDDRVDVEIYYLRAFLGSAGHDYEATAQIAATVRLKRDHRIARQVKQTFGIKVTRLALPPPLTQASAIVLKPVGLAGLDGNDIDRFVSENLRNVRTIQSQYAKMILKLTQGVTELGQKAPGSPEYAFTAAVNDAYARVGGRAQGSTDHLGLVAAFGNFLNPNPPLPAIDTKDLKEPVHAIGVATAPRIDLARIDIQNRTQQLIALTDKNRAALTERQAELQKFKDDDLSDAHRAAHLAYTQALTAYLDGLAHVFAAIKAFQVTIKFAARDDARSGPLFKTLRGTGGLFTATQMRFPFNALTELATFVLEEDPPNVRSHRQISAKLMALIEQLSAAPRGETGATPRTANAFIYVKNPTEPLAILKSLPGRLILCVTGNCVIAAGAATDQDVLTIIAQGDKPGGVIVRGDLRASLVLSGATATFEPSARIVGTVLLDDVPLTPAAKLDGSVVIDRRLAGTDDDAFWYVSVSPWVRSRLIERKGAD